MLVMEDRCPQSHDPTFGPIRCVTRLRSRDYVDTPPPPASLSLTHKGSLP
jgi:hypothetical protein